MHILVHAKIIIDTNLLIQAFIFTQPPAELANAEGLYIRNRLHAAQVGLTLRFVGKQAYPDKIRLGIKANGGLAISVPLTNLVTGTIEAL